MTAAAEGEKWCCSLKRSVSHQRPDPKKECRIKKIKQMSQSCLLLWDIKYGRAPTPYSVPRGWLFLPRKRWPREFSNSKSFQRNTPSWHFSHLGSSREWMGWADETGQLWSVHNNRVWVMCTVWSDLPCLLSCSHPEAISKIKLQIGRGEFLSNYENVSGKDIFTKAC